MRAIRFPGPRNIDIVDIPEPTMNPEEVLVDIQFAGLCGSDLNVYRGLFPLVTYPRIPGHEISGTIIARGNRVPPRIEEGARVMLNPYSECGLCPACRAGRPNFCELNTILVGQR